MSYILDALKKFESDRLKKKSLPDLHSIPTTHPDRQSAKKLFWPYALIGLLVLNSGVIAFFLLSQYKINITIPSLPAVPSPVVPTPAAAPPLLEPQPVATIAAPKTNPPQTVREEKIPQTTALRDNAQSRQIPPARGQLSPETRELYEQLSEIQDYIRRNERGNQDERAPDFPQYYDRLDGGSVAGARDGARATDRLDGGSVAGAREGAGATGRPDGGSGAGATGRGTRQARQYVPKDNTTALPRRPIAGEERGRRYDDGEDGGSVAPRYEEQTGWRQPNRRAGGTEDSRRQEFGGADSEPLRRQPIDRNPASGRKEEMEIPADEGENIGSTDDQATHRGIIQDDVMVLPIDEAGEPLTTEPVREETKKESRQAPRSTRLVPPAQLGRALGRTAEASKLTPKKAPDLSELPSEIREKIPELNISVHYFEEGSGQKFIVVNGKRKKEGDSASGELKVEEITKDGVVFRFKNERFYRSVF